MKKYLALLILPFYLTGCIFFYPKFADNQPAKCELVTDVTHELLKNKGKIYLKHFGQ